METTIQEPEVFALETLKVESLPELQGWREKQQAIAKANPFIAVKNHKTYTEAKKRRTALVSARTSIQDQEKVIASQLKQFRIRVSELSQDLISITLPGEEKQQAEVKRYEAEKEKEREEKELAEQKRIDAIRDHIGDFYAVWKKVISELSFEGIESTKKEIVTQLQEQDEFDFAEFKEEFNDKVMLIRELFKDRVKIITEQEAARLEREKLAKDKADFEAKKKKEEDERVAREKKAAKIEEDKKYVRVNGFIDWLISKGYEEDGNDRWSKGNYGVNREKLESFTESEFYERVKEVDENIKKDEELKALRDAQAKQDAEKKKREDKEAAELKAKQDADAKAKADKDAADLKAAQEKRLNELKPDKEKMVEYIGSFQFTKVYPELKDTKAIEILESLIQSHEDWIASSIDRITLIN